MKMKFEICHEDTKSQNFTTKHRAPLCPCALVAKLMANQNQYEVVAE